MHPNPIKTNQIQGDLDIFIGQYEEELDGTLTTWQEVLIHGNPEGLRSLAKILIDLADLNQEEMDAKQLPVGAREHIHLRPGQELSKSSIDVIVGRLDAKGTGAYYERYVGR